MSELEESTQNSSNKKKYTLLLVSIIICILFFELSCQFFLETFFDKKIQALTEDVTQEETLEDFMDKLGDAYNLNKASPKFPHPYFGYTRPLTQENLSLESNVYGFVERPELWKLQKDANTITIGFFGASVAAKAFLFEKEKNIFTAALARHLKLPSTKKIRLLNFSYGGYKQPQQFIIAAFFLDKLDASINIDGANELSSVTSPYHPLHFPKQMISSLYFSQNLYASKIIQLALFTNYSAASRCKKMLSEKKLSFSFLRTIIKARIFYLWKRIIKNLNQINDSQPAFWHSESKQIAGKTSVYLWSKFLRQQHILAKSLGVSSVYVLQPVPYAINKRLSPEELIFLSKIDAKRLKTLKYNHSFFAKESSHLKESGLPVFNFQSLFDNTQQTVFTDSCCHLNEDGNSLLMEKLAEILASEIKRNKKILKN